MDSPRGAAVTAEDFGLKGPRGWVFRGVGIDAAPGSLIAVEGPSGSGRTCLLLALTGRMKATEGRARVGGHDLPKRMAAVRRTTALGPVAGVNELDPSLTVAEQLREGALLRRRYGGPVRALLRSPRARAAATAARIDAAVAAAGLDVDALPKGMRTSVRDLERLEGLRLSLAIALLGAPGLIAVDDADLKLSDAERVEAWALLRGLTEAGTTVLAVCSQAPADAIVLRTGTAAPAPAEGGPASAAFAPSGSAPARSRRRSRSLAAATGKPTAPADAPQSAPAPEPAVASVEPGGSTGPAAQPHPPGAEGASAPSAPSAPEGDHKPAAGSGPEATAEADAKTADKTAAQAADSAADETAGASGGEAATASGASPSGATATDVAPPDATTPTDDKKEAADALAEARRA